MKAIKRKFFDRDEILRFNTSNNFEIERYFSAIKMNFEDNTLNLWFDHSYAVIADSIIAEAIYLDSSKKIEKYDQPPKNERRTSGSANRAEPVSVKRLEPWTKTYPLSAISSACLAFCSTINIEIPLRAISIIRSNNSSITIGETPAVGSSSIKTFGCVIKARPTATCWRCPPDSSPAA